MILSLKFPKQENICKTKFISAAEQHQVLQLKQTSLNDRGLPHFFSFSIDICIAIVCTTHVMFTQNILTRVYKQQNSFVHSVCQVKIILQENQNQNGEIRTLINISRCIVRVLNKFGDGILVKKFSPATGHSATEKTELQFPEKLQLSQKLAIFNLRV